MNFKNRFRFNKVTTMSLVVHFFWNTVYIVPGIPTKTGIQGPINIIISLRQKNDLIIA